MTTAFGADIRIDFEYIPYKPTVWADKIDEMQELLERQEGPAWAAWAAISDEMYRHFIVSGPGWQEWARDYPESQSILIQSEDLSASMYNPASWAVHADANSATIAFTGAASPFYWEYHQEGRSRVTVGVNPFGFDDDDEDMGQPTWNLPARPFIYTTPALSNLIAGIYTSWLDAIINVTFGGAPGDAGTFTAYETKAQHLGGTVAFHGVTGRPVGIRGAGGRFIG